jgi:hypothetical protein
MSIKLKPWHQYRIEESGYAFNEIDHIFQHCFKLSKRLRRFLLLKAFFGGIKWRALIEGWRGVYGSCSE